MAISAEKLEMQIPPPYTGEKIDDLKRFKMRVLRKIFRILAPYMGARTEKLWPLAKIGAFVLGRNYFYTKRANGDWICLSLPVYVTEFLYGADMFGYRGTIFHTLRRQARKDTVALDVGASCGQEVCFLSRAVGDGGIVYSFEPARSYECLLRTVSWNGLRNVVCIRAACGKQAGYIAGNRDDCYFIKADNCYKGKKGVTTVTYEESGDIPVTTVDLFLKEIKEQRPVSVIKIDTDGSEYDVIEGAQETAERNKGISILTEFVPNFNYSGIQGKAFLQKMSDIGYNVHKIQMSESIVDEKHFDDFIGEMKDDVTATVHDIVLKRKAG